MTTIVSALSSYKFLNKSSFALTKEEVRERLQHDLYDELLPSQFFLQRTVENIMLVERLCHKVAKAVLNNPDVKVMTLPLPSKRSCLLQPRIVNAAQLVLQRIYGNIDLETKGNSILIKWHSKEKPVLNQKEHLNSKLFLSCINNNVDKAVELLKLGADPNAIGPFGRTPLFSVVNNIHLFTAMLKMNADPYKIDDLGISVRDLVRIMGGYNTRHEQAINDFGRSK